MSKVHHYFDLFDHISHVTSPEVAAQMASSVAFRVDIMIISAARQLYKDIRTTQYEAGIDQMAELTLALNQQASAETAFYEHGSTNTGPISTIKELMYQREAWHALAANLTALTCDWKGIPRTYAERSIEDQIFEPGQMKVTVKTKSKMADRAKRDADAFGSPEMATVLLANSLRRKEAKNGDMVENMKTMAQGVAHMFNLACKHTMEDPSGETTMEFSSLSLEARGMMIMAAINAASKAIEWATEDDKMDDSTYNLICLSGDKSIKELRAQLKMPAFTNAAHQAAAAEKMTG